MAPISDGGWAVDQMFLRDLRVDGGALPGAENEQAGRDDQRGLDGKNDRNLTRKGVLQHGPSLQAAELRRFDPDQSRRLERGKQKYEGDCGAISQQSITLSPLPIRLRASLCDEATGIAAYINSRWK
jgi:hypothetical protein